MSSPSKTSSTNLFDVSWISIDESARDPEKQELHINHWMKGTLLSAGLGITGPRKEDIEKIAKRAAEQRALPYLSSPPIVCDYRNKKYTVILADPDKGIFSISEDFAHPAECMAECIILAKKLEADVLIPDRNKKTHKFHLGPTT